MASKFFFHEPTKRSNLIVHALGKKYFLHKIFMVESPYFNQLIKEMKNNEIRLGITDRQITTDSIDFVFCYVYQADVVMNDDVVQVAAILATAVFFKFKKVVEVASEKVMDLCCQSNNCFALYNLVTNVPTLKTKIFKYMQINILVMERNSMREVYPTTMRELILSRNFVVTDELALYDMLKSWFQELIELNTIFTFNISDTLFAVLNVPHLTQSPNIRRLKQERLIPRQLIHEATDTNCEMLMRLMADMDSIPEAKSRVLHRYGKVIFRKMAEQEWLGNDFRLGFSLRYFLSETGLRFQKEKVKNIIFATNQSHRLEFCLQVYSLNSTVLQPLLERTIEHNCIIPAGFVLLTPEDIQFPIISFPLVVSIKTTLLPSPFHFKGIRKRTKT